MIWLLACTATPVDSSAYSQPPGDSHDSVVDSVPVDSEDSAVPFEDVEPGEDCSERDWPIDTPWNVLAHRLAYGQAEPEQVQELRDLWAFMQEENRLGPAGERLRGPWVDLQTPEAEAVLDGISVPEAVVGPDGALWLVYVDGDMEGLIQMAEAGQAPPLGVIGFVGLGVARSEDGLAWARQELSVDWGGSPRLGAIVDPDVQRLEDGSYRLYALGFHASGMCADSDDPFGYPSPHDAVAFTSTDLLHWTYEGVVWSSDKGTDPGTWCEGATCWLHMQTSGVSQDGGASFEATSLDLPEEQPQLIDVRSVEGGFEMLYKRLDQQDLWRATSTDGVGFAPVEPLPIEGDSPTAVTWKGQAWVYTKSQ